MLLYPETTATDRCGTAHHIAAHLCGRDVAVLYVNPHQRPRHHLGTGPATCPESAQSGPLHLHQRQWAVLDLPLSARAPVVSEARTARVIRRAVASLGGSVRAILHTGRTPTVLDLIPTELRVFWAEEDYSAAIASTGAEPGRYAAAEQRLANHADVVLAASAALAHRWASQGFRTTVIPPGCELPSTETSHHEAATDEEASAAGGSVPKRTSARIHLPPPIACILGPFGPHYDITLLDTLTAAGRSILLIGDVHSGADPAPWQRFAEHPRVQWVTPGPAENLTGLIRCAHVGLLPVVDSAATRARFHASALDFLAAGVGVVSTPTPSVEWLACPHIAVAPRAGYVAAVATALDAPATPDAITARCEFASHHAWPARVDALLDLIGPHHQQQQ